jgi:acetyl esterase/lipase
MRLAPLAFASVTTLLTCLSACQGPAAVHADVPYDERFGEATSMDVYEPDGDGPHPGVMFIHGGAWAAGSKDEYTDAAKRLARSGYVTATINYRLTPEGTYPRNVQDCVCALAYLRAKATTYKLDVNRIALIGYSAGGHLASLIGVSTDDDMHAPDCAWGRTGPPRAVVAGAGVHDLRGSNLQSLFGASEHDVPALYAHASPITHVHANAPPYLFIHGTDDWMIQKEQAFAMRDALALAGNDARVYEVAGGGHVLQGSSSQMTVEESDLTSEGWIAILDFLERTIGRLH